MNVLIIEDDASDAEAIVAELESYGLKLDSCKRVDSMDALAEALNNSSWDVFVCDYVIPGLSWEAVLDACRGIAPDTPFVVVSGKRGEEYAVEVMRAGAQDYVTNKNWFAWLLPSCAS